MPTSSFTSRINDLLRSDNNSIESFKLQLRRVSRIYTVLAIIAVSQLLSSLKANEEIVIFRSIYAFLFVLNDFMVIQLCCCASLWKASFSLLTIGALFLFNIFYFIYDLIANPTLWALFTLVSLIFQGTVVVLVYQLRIKIQEKAVAGHQEYHPAAATATVDIEMHQQSPPIAPAIILKDGEGSGRMTNINIVKPIAVGFKV